MYFKRLENASFDYSKLKARTVEMGKSDKDVAYAAEMTASTYSLKLNGKSRFTQDEIIKICDFLVIERSKIPDYFFAV